MGVFADKIDESAKDKCIERWINFEYWGKRTYSCELERIYEQTRLTSYLIEAMEAHRRPLQPDSILSMLVQQIRFELLQQVLLCYRGMGRTLPPDAEMPARYLRDPDFVQ